MSLSRRRFLGQAAGVVAAGVASNAQEADVEVFLEARRAAGVVAANPVEFWSYGGAIPGPLLEVHPGQTLRVHLRNSLPEATNLHFHGMHVSPAGDADNSFREVPPGEQASYRIPIPSDHTPGLFWYHPHVHGSAARQVFRGLAGPIVMRGGLDAIPEIAAAGEQVFVLQDFTSDGNGRIPEPNFGERMRGREGSTILVNGEVMPTFHIRQNGLLRWRFLNASCSRYYRIKVEEHPLAVIGVDIGPLPITRWENDWLLVPGQRLDVLIAGDRPPGSYRVLSLPYDRGSAGMMSPPVSRTPLLLAHLHYAGSAERIVPVPDLLLTSESLPVAAVSRRLVFTEGMMGAFQINGRSFDPARTDAVVALGSVEDWEIENRGGMDHPFHMHVNAFQLVGTDGATEPGWLDVVNVPRGARIRIRIPFRDYTGKTLYHCHILDHEDLGMMGALEIA